MIELGLETAISRTAATIVGGGVVAFPTDTVYALAASLAHPPALARLYQVKQRPLGKPIPILLASASDLAKVALAVDPATLRFVAGVWPGQVTVILSAREELPDAVTALDEQGRRTVAVRVPGHAVARSVIERAGGAIAATSANTSGQDPALSAAEAACQLGTRIDFILDGGRAPGGVASTIVALRAAGPLVIREGSVPAAQITTQWTMLGARTRPIE